ncbi:hypothetical protein [Desulfonema ishimotonii]|uniref:hypothetical protein n=1 Tax=Desulfonema ishimotonii TaxID=45657 RepID=UPI000F58D89A|nr:hypothetical protein [Desulfonema ishimotonii]
MDIRAGLPELIAVLALFMCLSLPPAFADNAPPPASASAPKNTSSANPSAKPNPAKPASTNTPNPAPKSDPPKASATKSPLPDEFCFRHKETEAMMFECEEVKNPNHPAPKIQCYDPEKKDYVTFEPDQDWEMHTGDDCKPPRLDKSDVPKGPNE